MPRALRHFLSGHVWHITHRCHDRKFYLEQALYRKLWLDWLYEAKIRYNIPILNFTVTSNHIHLLVSSPKDMESIPRAIQLVAGRTAQVYNKNHHRSGAFWEKRYAATAVESGEHLARCMLYIDFNMVRAKVVNHPKEWKHCGYHEIINPKSRNQLLDRKKLAKKLDINEEVLTRQYERWIKEGLDKGNLTRDAVWSSNIAAGSIEYMEKIKRRLQKIKTRGPRLLSGRNQAVWDESAEYGIHMDTNKLEWEIGL